jgi:hypothetical protein
MPPPRLPHRPHDRRIDLFAPQHRARVVDEKRPHPRLTPLLHQAPHRPDAARAARRLVPLPAARLRQRAQRPQSKPFPVRCNLFWTRAGHFRPMSSHLSRSRIHLSHRSPCLHDFFAAGRLVATISAQWGCFLLCTTASPAVSVHLSSIRAADASHATVPPSGRPIGSSTSS